MMIAKVLENLAYLYVAFVLMAVVAVVKEDFFGEYDDM